MTKHIFMGVMIPFLGTASGACCVFFLKQDLKTGIRKKLLGFASGVMVAASVWSLLLPALEMAEQRKEIASFFPAAAGFLTGILFLMLLNRLIICFQRCSDQMRKMESGIRRTMMLVFAVTLHNIPEGMAVGAVFAGMAHGCGTISLLEAFVLSAGIAVQNLPEGAIVSIPLKSETGMSRIKAFLVGTLSGIVEPAAAVLMFVMMDRLEPVLPYLLSFAAGAMLYVVVEELIPQMSEKANSEAHSDSGTIGFAVGFVLMMVMDVVFG